MIGRLSIGHSAPTSGGNQSKTVGMSKLFKNVPIVNLLEMSPFVVDVVDGMRSEAKPCS
jgi:hypothetical protein